MQHNATSISLSHPVIHGSAWSGTSPRYSHVPTSLIVDSLQQAGWVYTAGTARISRRPERQEHVAHVLRFSHPSMPTIRGNRPEAVVVNSHDGTTRLKVMLGIFRVACANGLVVQSESVGGVSMVRSGLRLDDVISAVDSMIYRAPRAIEIVDKWSSIHLDGDQTMALARRMARVRWPDATSWSVLDAIAIRRPEDSGDDLWTVFNRIQESIIRGGPCVTIMRDVNGQRTPRTFRAGAIRGALRAVEINENLWAVGEEAASAF